MIDTPDFLRDAVSRRTFLTRMAAAGLGTAAAALIAGCGGGGNNQTNTTGQNVTNPLGNFADPTNFPGIPGANENIVVLNYALTLETLEADIYRQCLNIAAGLPLTTPLPADGGASYTQAVGNGTLSCRACSRLHSCICSSIPPWKPRIGTSCGLPSPPWAARLSRRTRKGTASPRPLEPP